MALLKISTYNKLSVNNNNNSNNNDNNDYNHNNNVVRNFEMPSRKCDQV